MSSKRFITFIIACILLLNVFPKVNSKELTFCPYCNIECSECGKIYNKVDYKLCPHCNPKCIDCGRIYSKKLSSCPHCNIKCPDCGKIYNTHDNISCPHCKDKREKLIALALFLVFIIFTIIIMYLF